MELDWQAKFNLYLFLMLHISIKLVRVAVIESVYELQSTEVINYLC